MCCGMKQGGVFSEPRTAHALVDCFCRRPLRSSVIIRAGCGAFQAIQVKRMRAEPILGFHNLLTKQFDDVPPVVVGVICRHSTGLLTRLLACSYPRVNPGCAGSVDHGGSSCYHVCYKAMVGSPSCHHHLPLITLHHSVSTVVSSTIEL